MMTGIPVDESRRTAALALWRYGHDYLKAAQALGEQDRVACNESQVLYHLAAQGIEFALKSYLRAKGVTPADLSARVRHSLLEALYEALARGLPQPPVELMRAIQFIAPHHRNDQFRYVGALYGEFPELTPLLNAGTWILSQIVEDVVADYFAHHGRESRLVGNDMLQRMRADLSWSTSKIPTRQ